MRRLVSAGQFVSDSEESARLHGKARADARDGVAHVDALVDGDDIRAALRHALHQAAAAADVQDDLQVWMRLCAHRQRMQPLSVLPQYDA